MDGRQFAAAGAVCCLLLGILAGCSPAAGGEVPPDRGAESGQLLEPAPEEAPAGTETPGGAETPQMDWAAVDYSAEFQSLQGCAVLLEPGSDTLLCYEEERCGTRVSPNSTFKIVSALMGLHNGVVTSAESTMGYDGTRYPVEAWNLDLSLKEAFQSSCVWYFRAVIDAVGQERVQEELDGLGYGNCDLSEWGGSGVNPLPELNGFWIGSSLLISPVEQVLVLRDILEGNTVYTEDEVEVLKDLMRLDPAETVGLYGKTGTGADGTAWFVGFMEAGDGTTYFAVYLDGGMSQKADGDKAKEIALDILLQDP